MKPQIARVVEIKRQIDLVCVILTDGKLAFRSKSDLTQAQKDAYYLEIDAELSNPFENDAEGIAAAKERLK